MNIPIIVLLEDEAPRTVANLLYVAVGSLSAVIVYLFVSHKSDLKNSTRQIRCINRQSIRPRKRNH